MKNQNFQNFQISLTSMLHKIAYQVRRLLRVKWREMGMATNTMKYIVFTYLRPVSLKIHSDNNKNYCGIST